MICSSVGSGASSHPRAWACAASVGRAPHSRCRVGSAPRRRAPCEAIASALHQARLNPPRDSSAIVEVRRMAE